MKFFSLVLLSALSFSAIYATGVTNVNDAIFFLCSDLMQLLPVVSMLMVVVAGIIYAAGQVMGAETRARANVWATAALIGALIGVLIFAIAPAVLSAIYGVEGAVSCSAFSI
jgi:hypothetical protein